MPRVRDGREECVASFKIQSHSPCFGALSFLPRHNDAPNLCGALSDEMHFHMAAVSCQCYTVLLLILGLGEIKAEKTIAFLALYDLQYEAINLRMAQSQLYLLSHWSLLHQ